MTRPWNASRNACRRATARARAKRPRPVRSIVRRTSGPCCQTTIHERCTTSCQDKGGAIFCDGQFINAASLENCAAELSAEISISLNVDIDIDTHVDTDGDGDTESVNCSFSPTSSSGAAFWIVAGLAGVSVLRRRRNRAQK